MIRSLAALVVTMVMLPLASAFAQDQPPPKLTAHAVTEAATDTRPTALIPLYLGQAALQAYDGWATLEGVRRGATETNPLVGGLAEHAVAFWSIKAASTIATIYGAETLWRAHHRRQAIALMIVANGVMAAVAVRDASILNSR